MTDQDRLAEIRQRRASITPGRWERGEHGDTALYASGGPVAEVLGPTPVGELLDDADAIFIAHAPDDIDWLLDQAELAKELGDLLPQKINEIERLRGLRQRLREIEWSASLPTYGEDCGHFSTEDGCPACQQSSLDGHAPDCWLAAALA